jgi:hypothetical protein
MSCSSVQSHFGALSPRRSEGWSSAVCSPNRLSGRVFAGRSTLRWLAREGLLLRKSSRALSRCPKVRAGDARAAIADAAPRRRLRRATGRGRSWRTGWKAFRRSGIAQRLRNARSLLVARLGCAWTDSYRFVLTRTRFAEPSCLPSSIYRYVLHLEGEEAGRTVRWTFAHPIAESHTINLPMFGRSYVTRVVTEDASGAGVAYCTPIE